MGLLQLGMVSGSLLTAIMGPVEINFYCHLVDGSLMGNHAKLLFLYRRFFFNKDKHFCTHV